MVFINDKLFIRTYAFRNFKGGFMKSEFDKVKDFLISLDNVAELTSNNKVDAEKLKKEALLNAIYSGKFKQDGVMLIKSILSNLSDE